MLKVTSSIRSALFLAALVGTLAGVRHATAQAAAAKTESALEGRWEVTELTRGDVATKILPEEDMTGVVLFDRDRFRFQIESFGYVDHRSSATFELDTSRSPNRIDLTFTAGPNAGKTAKG